MARVNGMLVEYIFWVFFQNVLTFLFLFQSHKKWCLAGGGGGGNEGKQIPIDKKE